MPSNAIAGILATSLLVALAVVWVLIWELRRLIKITRELTWYVEKTTGWVPP